MQTIWKERQVQYEDDLLNDQEDFKIQDNLKNNENLKNEDKLNINLYL